MKISGSVASNMQAGRSCGPLKFERRFKSHRPSWDYQEKVESRSTSIIYCVISFGFIAIILIMINDITLLLNLPWWPSFLAAINDHPIQTFEEEPPGSC